MEKHYENIRFYGVRYIVADIDAAVLFYKELLGFTIDMKARRVLRNYRKVIFNYT